MEPEVDTNGSKASVLPPISSQEENGVLKAGFQPGQSSKGDAREKQGKRKRKRRGPMLSQEELDAKHPGNMRNREAVMHVSAAYSHWSNWRPQQQAARPQQQQQQQQLSPSEVQQHQQPSGTSQQGNYTQTHQLQHLDKQLCSKQQQGGHPPLQTRGNLQHPIDLLPPQYQAETNLQHSELGSQQAHDLTHQGQIKRPHTQQGTWPVHSGVTQACSAAHWVQTEQPYAQQQQQQQAWRVTVVHQDSTGRAAVSSLSPQPAVGGSIVQGAGNDLTPGQHTTNNDTLSVALDWVALGAYKKVLKPKLQLMGEQGMVQPQHLFSNLIVNPHDHDTLALAHEALVLLPQHSGFIMGDLMEQRTLAPLLAPVGCPGSYKHVVLDPPWENKSVARSGQYQQIPARQLLKLPIARLLHQDGTVYLWITNREQLWRFVRNELLPAWGLRHAATWWWLKLDAAGSPVTPLHSMHRHPFEAVLLLKPAAAAPPASPSNHTKDPASAFWAAHGNVEGLQGTAGQPDTQHSGSEGEDTCNTADGVHTTSFLAASPTLQGSQCLADGLVFMCTPAAEHSRKPHLGPLIDTFASGNKQGVQGVEGMSKPQSVHHVCNSLCRLPMAASCPAQAGSQEAESQGTLCEAKVSGGSSNEEGSKRRGLCGKAGQEDNERLELFARELHPWWDAVGDEVLRFQQLSCFAPHRASALTVLLPVWWQ